MQKLTKIVWLEDLKSDWGCLTFFKDFSMTQPQPHTLRCPSVPFLPLWPSRRNGDNHWALYGSWPERRWQGKCSSTNGSGYGTSKLMLSIGRGNSWKLPVSMQLFLFGTAGHFFRAWVPWSMCLMRMLFCSTLCRSWSRTRWQILLTATPRRVDRWRLGVIVMLFPSQRRSPWSPQLWWCLWAKGFNGNMAWHICSAPTLELWMPTPCLPPSCHVDAGWM